MCSHKHHVYTHIQPFLTHIHTHTHTPTHSHTPNPSLHTQELYRAAKARFDEDEEFKQRARVAVTELQGGKPEYVAAWKRICAASRREFQAIYERLGVELEERGESYYNPALKVCVRGWGGEGCVCVRGVRGVYV